MACGRFAPSPTGPLHFGSLVAALGSLLDARRRGGRWLVRIEDLDTPRNAAGAGDSILRDLERFAMHWDGEVVRQSGRAELYAQALDTLASRGWTFECGCSRRDLVDGIYPGTCRDGLPAGRAARSVRFRVPAGKVEFHDAVQGVAAQRVQSEVGDFVVLRADRIVAYHLAVVVDDAAQRVGEVVRGCDLLDSTPRQILIQRALGLATPEYVHLPVAVNADRNKLGKRSRAPSVAAEPPGVVLADALEFLGQRPPSELARAPAREIVAWGIEHWDRARVPRRRTAPAPDYSAQRRLRSCLQ